MRTQLPIALIAAVSATALLAACKDQNTGVLPPPTGAPIASMGLDQDVPPPPVYAPPAERLAPARPIRVSAAGPDPGRYLYVDDAYDMIDAFGDSPPDYAFDYDGVEPWVWRSDAGYYRVVEFVPDGLREYYYEPGYDEPFLIRDPRYSYGYDRGVLVTVYDSYGRALPRDMVVRQADYAGRYYARAEQLHYAALHQQRRPAYARQWQDRQDSLAEARQRWAIQRDRDNEWRQLRDRRGDVQRATWAPEQRQRADYAARFAAEQKSRPERGFMQAFRGERERDRAREDQQARAQAERAQQLAQQDRQRQGGRGDPREEAQRRQAEAQAQRMNYSLRRQEQAQAMAQPQMGRQAERMARQDARRDQRLDARFAEAQRHGADRAQADQARLAQARAADQHAAQASAREQMRAQAEGQRRNAEAQQRQAQAERQRSQAQRAQMEQQRAQASEQRRAQAEQQLGQARQAQRAQVEQQQRAQAMEQRRARAEQQRGQERQAQRAQMEQQRGQAMRQQRAQAEQQRAQAQQQRAEAANAQRQARDASAHERQAAQAQAAQAQKQHGNDKHDRPH